MYLHQSDASGRPQAASSWIWLFSLPLHAQIHSPQRLCSLRKPSRPWYNSKWGCGHAWSWRKPGLGGPEHPSTCQALWKFGRSSLPRCLLCLSLGRIALLKPGLGYVKNISTSPCALRGKAQITTCWRVPGARLQLIQSTIVRIALVGVLCAADVHWGGTSISRYIVLQWVFYFLILVPFLREKSSVRTTLFLSMRVWRYSACVCSSATPRMIHVLLRKRGTSTSSSSTPTVFTAFPWTFANAQDMLNPEFSCYV